MADGRREPKSKYTLDRGMPGAFEGETVTRRRFMTLTAHGAGRGRRGRLRAARRSASPPARRCSTGRPSSGSRSARRSDFPDDTYLPRVITEVAGIGQVGKTTIYVRARNAEIDAPPNPPGYDEQFIARLDPLHAPRLPGPLHRGRQALRLPVPRRRLRLPRQGRRRPAGAAARPLLHARAATARSRSARATRSTASSAASRPTATPRRTSTASASTSTRAASPRPRWTSP